MAVINRNSQMQTLDNFLENVERTFGDPDRACMAHTQLHDLKVTPNTTAGDYMAWFEMLSGLTSFNDKALEDAYIQGLPNSILQKVFAQVTLPKGLDVWKMVVWNLDCLHRGLMVLKGSTGKQTQLSDAQVKQPAIPNHRLLPPLVSPHTSWLTHRHWIPSLPWM